MAFEPREGAGALFNNDRGKKKNDRAPDWKGDVMFEGRVLEVVGWVKPGKFGNFISLAIKVKEAREDKEHPPRQTYEPAPPAPAAKPDFEDDIPF